MGLRLNVVGLRLNVVGLISNDVRLRWIIKGSILNILKMRLRLNVKRLNRFKVLGLPEVGG